MSDIRKYFWVFPIIGVIFGIITFLAPVITLNLNAYDSIDWHYWIWGLTSFRFSNPDPFDPKVTEIIFTNNIKLLTFSIISTIAIAVGVTLLLIAGITSKRNIRYSKKSMVMTGISAILLIGGGILFWVGADWPTTPHSLSSTPGVSVWNLFDEGFGVYAPFIGGGIALLAIPLHYYVFKRKTWTPTVSKRRFEKPIEKEESSLIPIRSKGKFDMKKYIWVFPIIGAIFALISIATPVFGNLTIYDVYWDDTHQIPFDAWMIGYWESGTFNDWIHDLSIFGVPLNASLAPFLLSFIGLLFGAILGIGTGVLGYRGDYRRNISALSGILMIFFTLLFIIWVEVEWSPFSGDTVEDEWLDLYEYKFDPDFGVIGPFIGGAICLAGAFIQPGERTMPLASKQSKMMPKSTIKYCYECGSKATGKFCARCGTRLKI